MFALLIPKLAKHNFVFWGVVLRDCKYLFQLLSTADPVDIPTGHALLGCVSGAEDVRFDCNGQRF